MLFCTAAEYRESGSPALENKAEDDLFNEETAIAWRRV